MKAPEERKRCEERGYQRPARAIPCPIGSAAFGRWPPADFIGEGFAGRECHSLLEAAPPDSRDPAPLVSVAPSARAEFLQSVREVGSATDFSPAEADERDGSYQIGDDQARSRIDSGWSFGRGRFAERASNVDHRGVGISRTRT